MKFIPILTAGLIGASVATGAFAAGSDSGTTTKTTKECKKGKVYDEKKKRCVKIKKESNLYPDEFLIKNAVEFAYAGQLENAIHLLKIVKNQDDPRVLNYLGFTNRKLGNTEIAMGYYQKALAIDPNYNLARSYMGQGFVADGNFAAAKVQLAEIRKRGGAGTWAYVMLQNAITSKVTY